VDKTMTIGLDLAKNVFHIVCCDEHGKVVRKKMQRRSQLMQYFANLADRMPGGDGGLRERPPLGTRTGCVGTPGKS
jgi:hypothetical protein